MSCAPFARHELTLYSCGVGQQSRHSVCGWPRSRSLFSPVLHYAECVFLVNTTYLHCARQRPMTRCGPSRRASLRLRPKTSTSAMRSLCSMWLRTAPSSTMRWPTICTLRTILRSGEPGNYVICVLAFIFRLFRPSKDWTVQKSSLCSWYYFFRAICLASSRNMPESLTVVEAKHWTPPLLTHSKKRSRTMNVPGAAHVAPVEVDTPTYLEVPDFQRVAIIGDYASGVPFIFLSSRSKWLVNFGVFESLP